ncbi:unnamed protein product, partial [marine sediment metagenome]
ARSTWTVIDTTSSTGDEPTDLTVTERTYQTAKAAQIAAVGGDGEISIFDIPRGWNSIRLRAIGITNDGTYTVQVYAGTLGDGNRDADSTAADCELAYIGQFAFVVGTQVSTTSTYEIADTVVFTTSDWIKTVTPVSPTGNRVAEVMLDLAGADVVVIVPTVASADAKLIGKGF